MVVFTINIPTDWCWYHCTPVGIPHHYTEVTITGHLVHNNTVKWKANKIVRATLIFREVTVFLFLNIVDVKIKMSTNRWISLKVVGFLKIHEAINCLIWHTLSLCMELTIPIKFKNGGNHKNKLRWWYTTFVLSLIYPFKS